MILPAIVVATLVAGVGSVLIAALLNRGVLARHSPHMLSLAAGALLATSFMLLLPEAFESDVEPHWLFSTILAALIFFFLLDKAELWHHGHEHGHEHEREHEHGAAARKPSEAQSSGAGSLEAGRTRDAEPDLSSGGWAVLMGDGLHCFADGVLIASAFVADLRLGVLAALAVLLHEVPHHMGDLAVVGARTRSLRSALFKVSLAGAMTLVGGLLGYVLVDRLHGLLPFFLVLAASSFMYVALADLIPQLQRRLSLRQTAAQVAWLILGLSLVSVAAHLAHMGHAH